MNLNVLGHQTTGKVRCRRCDSEHECQWLRDTTCDKPSIKCVSGRESLCRMCRPLARLCINCRPLHAWCRGCSRVLQKTAWIVKATGSDVAYNVCGQCVDRRLRTSARKKLEKSKQVGRQASFESIYWCGSLVRLLTPLSCRKSRGREARRGRESRLSTTKMHRLRSFLRVMEGLSRIPILTCACEATVSFLRVWMRSWPSFKPTASDITGKTDDMDPS